MSRIIVKQLPKNITEDKVRKVFESKGKITDVQLKYTSDGRFRQFCFIGYQTVEDAQEAIRYFNNSCIQTSRIKVELCAALGSEEKPRSWSKYSKDSKVNEDKNKKEQEYKDLKEKAIAEKKLKKFDEIIGKHKDDPEFQEFLKLHDKNRVLWANDVDVEGLEALKRKESKPEESKEESDDAGKDSGLVESEEDNGEKDSDESQENEEENEKLAEKPISDLEYMKSLIEKSSETTKPQKVKEKTKKNTSSGLDLYTIKIHNVPYKVKRQEIIKFFKPLKPYSVRLPTNVHGFCYVGFKAEKDMIKAMLKNKSFIKGKQVFFSDFTEKNKVTKSKKSGEASVDNQESFNKSSNPKWEKQQEGIRNEEDISESGKIFFRNLSYTVTEDDLQKVFEQFGPVAEIHLPVDTITRKIKGFGTVTFLMPEHAVQAFNKLDGTDFHGRLFHLIPGKSKDSEEDLNENQDNLSFQQKKALKEKQSAQQVGTWNTLFLGPNTVAELLAREFGTSKGRILDNDDGGSSAAVRLAMGETKIVVEMKKFLEDNHVCVNAFDVLSSKRSKTIILAKNLPAETSVEELKPIFGKFGPIGRLVLPPSGITAIIEYCDPSEARQAFKKLAFSKFKNVPLYLEWAPENTFTQTLTGDAIVTEKSKTKIETETEGKPLVLLKEEKKKSKKERLKEEAELAKAEEQEKSTIVEETKEETIEPEQEEDDEPPEPNTTLFLRNLNFKTIPDTIYNHFKHMGAIHHAEIAKRRDPKDPRYNESLGYGFIQFKKASIADKVLKNMQFTQIDSNQVELKRSDRVLKSQNQVTVRRKTDVSKQTGTKILVRNIPFQAQVKEVRDIFKMFGELRTVRIPKKMTPGEDSHRGFGFVDFISKTDARKAFEALSQSTHLYGRRLVLEWASITENEVDEIRKRTAETFDFGSSNVIKSQKRLRSELVTEMDKMQAKEDQGMEE